MSKPNFDILLNQLGDPNRSIRRQAAIALGLHKYRQAVPKLIKLLNDNESVFDAAAYAAKALGEIGDPRAVEPLIKMLEEPLVKGAAIEALAKLHDERALEPLIQLFEKTHVSSLATVLGNWGDKRATSSLIEAMQSPDSHVRYYTARALGKLRDPRALAILKQAKEYDTEPITDTKSIRGKSVSYVAAKAIEKITQIE